MNQAGLLERVIIVPWNGYVNRLQAWASASILAEHLGADLKVAWETESVAPVEANGLFADSQINNSFVDTGHVTALLGRSHREMPRYLTIDQARGVAFLAGHDRGEQHFMPLLQETLETTPGITTLVIVAGGKFHLSDEGNFQTKRRNLYQQIVWHPDIADRVTKLGHSHEHYLGLHIRQTDRSRDAPTQRVQERAVRQLARQSGIEHVLLSTDTDSARVEWVKRLKDLGLIAWTSDASSFDRQDHRSASDALVDWILLGRAEAIVYSSASSFGHEAAIMNEQPEWSRGLRAPALVRAFRDGKRLTGSALRVMKRS